MGVASAPILTREVAPCRPTCDTWAMNDRALSLPDGSKIRIVGLRPTREGVRALLVESTHGVESAFFVGQSEDAEAQAQAWVAGSKNGFGFEDRGDAPRDVLDAYAVQVGEA